MARIFGTAGVRGVFNETQSPGDLFKIAQAVAFSAGKGRYAVCWDGRKGSRVLARAVDSAVTSVGGDCITFGLIPTPVLAYGTRSRGCKAGFALTASHNPPEYCGMKVFNGNGMEISREEEVKVERVLAVSSWKPVKNMGTSEGVDVLESYKRELRSRFPLVHKGLTILVDCGNGPGGLVTPGILSELGHKVIPLNAQISSRFTARPPEPSPENVLETAKLVVALNADFGFAHDGDADRLVMINAAGQVVPDSVISILAMRALEAQSRTVVLSENSSSAIADEVDKAGGRVVRARVGKTFVRALAEHAAFACEPSKIVDPNWGMWEDGIYAAVLVSDLVSRNRDWLRLIESGTGWFFRQKNVHYVVDMRRLVQVAMDSFGRFRIAEKRDLDGVKLIFRDNSWVMFRSSGTEPLTRLYCESRDFLKMDELVEEGMKCIQAAKGL